MKTMIKATLSAVAVATMIAGSMTAPATASASPRTSYVCQAEKSNDSKTGTILGALIGGVLGSQVSKNEKGLGAVGGAVIGGVIGNKLGKDNGKATCNKIEAQAHETYGYGQPYRSGYSYNSRSDRYEQVRYQPAPYRYGHR